MLATQSIRYDATHQDETANYRFCVTLAALSYKSPAEIEKGLHEVGYGDAKFVYIKDNLTACLIVRRDDVTAVAFKGSTTWREWINNGNVWLEPTPYGRVHAGFLYTIERWAPLLHAMIAPDLQSGKKIVLAGHSRGGALASLFSFYLATQGHGADCVMTFGSPMFCDRQFASHWGHVSAKPDVDPIPKSRAVKLLAWVMSFRVIFIPVTLYLSVRVLVPHPLRFLRVWIWLKMKKALGLQ